MAKREQIIMFSMVFAVGPSTAIVLLYPEWCGLCVSVGRWRAYFCVHNSSVLQRNNSLPLPVFLCVDAVAKALNHRMYNKRTARRKSRVKKKILSR